MVDAYAWFLEWETLDWFNTLPIWTTLDLFNTRDEIKALVAKKSLLLLRRRDAKSQIFWESMNIADCLGCWHRSDDCDPDSSGAPCNNTNWGGLHQCNTSPDDSNDHITM